MTLSRRSFVASAASMAAMAASAPVGALGAAASPGAPAGDDPLGVRTDFPVVGDRVRTSTPRTSRPCPR